MSEGIGRVSRVFRSITNIFYKPIAVEKNTPASLSETCINALRTANPGRNYTSETGKFAEGRFTIVHRPDENDDIYAILAISEDNLAIQKTAYLDSSENDVLDKIVKEFKVPYE